MLKLWTKLINDQPDTGKLEIYFKKQTFLDSSKYFIYEIWLKIKFAGLQKIKKMEKLFCPIISEPFTSRETSLSQALCFRTALLSNSLN